MQGRVNPDCRDENCIDCPQPKVRNKPNRARASTSRTKRVDGENLTSDCFIYVGSEDEISTWHLPWKFSSEEKTESHLRDALARFDQTDIPEPDRPAARAKLVRLCKEHGITVSDSDKKAAKALAALMRRAVEHLARSSAVAR